MKDCSTKLKVEALTLFCMCLFTAACSSEPKNMPSSASGSLMIDVSSIIRGFVDAGTVVTASLRELWSDAQKRAADITEGTEKIREGKEQIEKGVRGD